MLMGALWEGLLMDWQTIKKNPKSETTKLHEPGRGSYLTVRFN